MRVWSLARFTIVFAQSLPLFFLLCLTDILFKSLEWIIVLQYKFQGEIQDINVFTLYFNLGKAHQLLCSNQVRALPTISILIFSFISMPLFLSISLFLCVCYNTGQFLFSESLLYKKICYKLYLHKMESAKHFSKPFCFINIIQLILSLNISPEFISYFL